MGNLANSTELTALRMTSGDGPRTLMRFIKIPLLALAISIPLGFVGIWMDNHSTHRVVVLWPDPWANDEYRNCSLGKSAIGETRPHLECGLNDILHSRLLTIDVRFDGDNYGQIGVDWTCQNRDGELVCKN